MLCPLPSVCCQHIDINILFQTMTEPTTPNATPKPHVPSLATGAVAASPLRSKDVLLPLARVRTIMKSSPDVENIGQESLFLITKVCWAGGDGAYPRHKGVKDIS
jgi:hypothetical protein